MQQVLIFFNKWRILRLPNKKGLPHFTETTPTPKHALLVLLLC